MNAKKIRWEKSNNIRVVKGHLPLQLHEKFKEKCKAQQVKISDVIAKFVREYVKD
jgi:hypothetical protein